MYVVLTVLLIIISLFILAIVLVQNPKGGGALGTAFGGAASNIVGVQRAGDTLERLTWGAAILMLILSVGSTFFLPVETQSSKSRIERTQAPQAPIQNQAPTMTLPDAGSPAATPMDAEPVAE
ncbi:MAG TPA: preprotein translocase subunit SecG [Chitinophagales bacterium]|nr:preprotein translocase subunit SecG [Chitinophagales bacterium]